MARYPDAQSVSGKYSANAAAAAGRYAEGVQNAGADWAAAFGPILQRQNSCGKSARAGPKGYPALAAYAQCMLRAGGGGKYVP